MGIEWYIGQIFREFPSWIAIGMTLFLGILLIIWLLLPLWVLFIQWNTGKIKDEIRNLADLMESKIVDEKKNLEKETSLVQKVEGGLLVLLLLGGAVAHSQGLLRVPLYLNSKEIRVEVAQTPEERAQGLMGRKSLGDSEGMLFIFETESQHSFWMKNTLIPLSIAFIDKDGRIVWITDMSPLTLDSHTPPKPILYALEMKKGWFAANGIKAGDRIRFSK